MKKFRVNKSTRKKKMVQCATAINKSAVRRESIDGIEHIIVSSFTLPDNIVMNGGLYPAEEIAKGFETLERTLAPVEHPTDSNGNFISASDPHAIHNFHAGAFNANVKRENGRVHIEKQINVHEALKTERGKRLLDRIDELENNEAPRPVHTSVGVFLIAEQTDGPKTNAAGDEYTWIAKDMVFDHDAILLDSVAAAQPEKGVGMAVNLAGEKVEAETFVINENKESMPQREAARDMRSNADGPSFSQITESLQKQLEGIVAGEWIWIVDIFDGELIFETPQGYFTVPFNMRNGEPVISGIPLRVDKKVEYQPKINSQKGDERMKDLILNALAAAGITTDGLSDDDLFAAYNKLVTVNTDSDDDNSAGDGIAEAITNAVNPLLEKIETLTQTVNAASDAERDELVKTVVNSKKYPGLDEDAAKLLPVESLKSMAANCGTAHGVPVTVNIDGDDDTFKAPVEMPK